jgi:hypothetical protein
MCERCSNSRTWSVELDGSFQCGVTTCELQAIALTYSQYVDEHLCQKHADLLNGQLDEFSHAIRQLGQISLDFLPIEQKASCAHFVDHPLLDDEVMTRCRRPATLAKVIIEGWPLCDEHKIKFIALHR